jgi:hypothetical protein
MADGSCHLQPKWDKDGLFKWADGASCRQQLNTGNQKMQCQVCKVYSKANSEVVYKKSNLEVGSKLPDLGHSKVWFALPKPMSILKSTANQGQQLQLLL